MLSIESADSNSFRAHGADQLLEHRSKFTVNDLEIRVPDLDPALPIPAVTIALRPDQTQRHASATGIDTRTKPNSGPSNYVPVLLSLQAMVSFETLDVHARMGSPRPFQFDDRTMLLSSQRSRRAVSSSHAHLAGAR